MKFTVLAFLQFCFFLLSTNVLCGQGTLKEHLLELAIQHDKSLIFNPDILPNTKLKPPTNTASISKSLNQLLSGTNIYYEILEEQILLFQKAKISGKVIDASSKESLISALVYDRISGQQTLSDENGFFFLSVRRDKADLIVNYLAYDEKQITLTEIDEGNIGAVGLNSNSSLKEVIISDQLSNNHDNPLIDLHRGTNILIEENNAITSIGGESDWLQTIYRQTGISTGADGIGGLHVRGGKADQNLFLLDGVKLYNPGHALGLLSMVNPSSQEQVVLYKNGNNSSNNGRLSSIVDISTKTADLGDYHMNYHGSTIASSFVFETPLIKDKLGLFVSTRRSHIDPFIQSRSIAKKEENFETGETNYHLYDINTNLRFKIDDRNDLQINFFKGGDKFNDYTDIYWDDFDDGSIYEYQSENEFKWNNQITSIQWSSLLGSSSVLNLLAYNSRYQYNSYNYFYTYDDEDLSDIIDENYFTSFATNNRENGIEIDISRHFDFGQINIGSKLRSNVYQPGVIVVDQTIWEDDFTAEGFLETNEVDQYDSKESTSFMSYLLNLGQNSSLDGSIFYTLHKTKDPYYENEKTYHLLNGHIKYTQRLREGLFIGGSYSKMAQTEHLLTTGDAGFPNDIWIPSTPLIQPETALQTEIFTKIKSKYHTLDLAFFTKNQKNLILFQSENGLPTLFEIEANFWEDEVATADATSIGLEVNYLYKPSEKWTTRIAYTWSKTTFTEDAESYPFSYDIPHSIALGSQYKINARFNFSLDWIYSSGRPSTLYLVNQSFSPFDNLGTSDTRQISETNDYRLPATHKLSFSFSTFWTWGKFNNFATFGLQNVYNHRNVLFAYEIEGEGLFEQVGFPLSPILTYRLGF